MSDRVLFWVPLPPPLAGPEMASELLVDACRPLLPRMVVGNATLRTSNMRKGRFDLEGVLAFWRSYRRFLGAARGSDVVYMAMAANGVGSVRDSVLVLTSRLMRRRVVIHLRGGRYRQYYAESGPAMRWLLRRSWGSASQALVETPRMASSLEEAAPHVPVAVVPNGLPGDHLASKQHYATDAPRILFVGHLIFSKGFNDLARAFRIVRERWPNAVLACAGELPQPEPSVAGFLPKPLRGTYMRDRHALCEEVRAFVKSEGVDYVGVVRGEDKQRLFVSCDLFVLPSYSEGFSIAILEAMFHGLPVIASDAGGSPDVVRDGVNGLVVPAGDIAALARSLERLLADPALRERMGRTNAREARERYDLSIAAQQLTTVLQSVAIR